MKKVKTAAATRQMQELVALLVDASMYHALTTEDRQQLIKEGYASDLSQLPSVAEWFQSLDQEKTAQQWLRTL
ncbi:hypothetical protein L1285_15110 [Pseudoalteromonas sp. DL2-H2.2]|uniref:hypothetical protein n=1 Tax=Pseudoalteromonas sp. DL2-H2.2 TaxID=2908889 RepID=UPI001F258EE1|nr:hypothetical protein [Pseudoalteromonas sp. DL2-H2.2]MCF2909652.1 hypothetical protein [Pseudoalteromonas sp. DL2-H2.2]